MSGLRSNIFGRDRKYPSFKSFDRIRGVFFSKKMDTRMLKIIRRLIIRLVGRSRDGLVRMSHSRMDNYSTMILMI